MPLPRPDRLGEYARKGVELGIRTIGHAPEQRAARRLSAQVEARSGTPKVLFLCPRDWAEHVQYQAMIGQALRLRGADVRFLTCGGGLEICDRANTYEAPPMPCRTCRRYVDVSVEAHGFRQSSIRAGWEEDTGETWPELDEAGMPQLRRVTDEGIPLGELVEIPVTWFLLRADPEADPLRGHTTRAFLRSARRIARGIARALDEYQPDTLVLLQGLFLFEAVAWSLCAERDIDVVTYERAFRRETLVFSRHRPVGHYDFSGDWRRTARPLTASEEDDLDRYLDQRRSGSAFDQHWRVRETQLQRPGGKLAVLFTNVTWDAAVVNREAAFASIRAWLDESIEVFAQRPDDQLVIRIHPSELFLPGKRTRDSLEEYVAATYEGLPPNVRLIGAADSISSYPLMAAADVGLVYTSTTGLELALAGTPVIVSGNTHYRGKGFTIDVSDPDQFRAAIEQVLADPDSSAPDIERARQYAHFFFFRAPVPAPYVSEPLPGLARITTIDADDLRPGRSANVDRICDGILHQRPFVLP